MSKLNVTNTILIVFSILIIGCTAPPSDGNPGKPSNIIVILDTSDRVSKTKNANQAKTDIEIAKGIVDLFERRVRKDLYIRSHHRIAFVVPEQPDTTPIPQEIIEKMMISPTDEDRLRGAPKFREVRKELLHTIDELYQFVEKRAVFTGADIWDWFRGSGEAYLKMDMQNYVICLTDGYLDFDRSIQIKRPKRGNKTSYIPYHQIVRFRNDPNWRKKFDNEGHGLLEIERNFSAYDVKFLMVEIAHRDMLDLDIIKKYWKKWLSSMGITKSQFLRKQADPQVVKEKIEEFLETPKDD